MGNHTGEMNFIGDTHVNNAVVQVIFLWTITDK